MMESKRTEGPWKRSEENAYSILTPQGGLIAKTSYHWVDPVSARLNAAFIVKACNNFEPLVDAVKDLLSNIDLKQYDVRKDFSFMVTHAAVLKALHAIEQA